MWVAALHSLFLYSDPPLPCQPPSDWLRLFLSQTLSRINTPKFSTPEKRQRQITRKPTLKAEENRLQRSVTRRLKEWRKDKWSATLESLDSDLVNSLLYLVMDSVKSHLILISNCHRVLNVVCFLLGNSPASEFYTPTFRNTLFHLHRQVGMKYDWI